MKIKNNIASLCIGAINSLIGSGGGLIAVPFLRSQGLSQQSAQATSIAVIMPLSLFSTLLYLKRGIFSLQSAAVYIVPGMIGAVIGGIALKKIPANALKVILSAFMLYSAVRLIIK